MTPDVPEDVYAGSFSYAVVTTADPDGGGGKAPAATGSDGGVPLSNPGAQGEAEAGAPPVSSDEPPNPSCDFSGRWLVTERRVAVGLGVQQAGLYWVYLDLEQHGDQLVVRKGLQCGTEVVPIGALSASVDMSGCWPSLMADNPMDGLTGRTGTTAAGCSFELDRFYGVFGATADYYRDPSVPMPTVDEQAGGGTPGWEDCDQDGSPGATLEVSGIVTGTRSEAIREWSEYKGSVPKVSSTFSVPIDWGQTESVLAVSSEALKATGGKDGDDSLHFAQFARLADAQAAGGSDDAICEQIRALAPQLTPEANQ